VAQLIPATAALVVTTPQEVSILDSRKAVTFARMMKLEILGVIENMSGFSCPHCGKPIQLFKEGGGKKLAQLHNVPYLGSIPIDPGIVESGDSGSPYMIDNEDSEAAKSFNDIVDRIIKQGK
jgi:Mrp family chromosome partitioning ATPase